MDSGLRVVCLFFPTVIAYVMLYAQPITVRHLTGVFLSTLWCFVILLFLNIGIVQLGAWSFNVRNIYSWAGVPVDLILGWAVLWGAIPLLYPGRSRPWVWVCAFFIFDILFMPHLAPAIQLAQGSSAWVGWDALCLAVAFVPAWYLGQWTRHRKMLYVRSFLQMILYVLIINVMVAMALLHFYKADTLEGFLHWVPIFVWSGFHNWFGWMTPSDIPWTFYFALAQGLFLVAVPGWSALQEFAIRGKGTPFPLDPPLKLITTGPYAYWKNPMQTCQTMIYFYLAFVLNSIGFYVAGFMAAIYYLGYARWDESRSMKRRFGSRWEHYRSTLRLCLPRWKPYRLQPATIYLDLYGCSACASWSRVLKALKPVQLVIKDARFFPDADIRRAHYRDADGYTVEGVHALARTLEHINLWWAWVGWTLRLPVISHVSQWFLDLIFPPHRVCRVPDVEAARRS